MKNDQKFLIGVLAFVLGFTLIMGQANALTTENNLSKPTLSSKPTAKAVFLVSKPKKMMVKKASLQILANYQDQVHLTGRQLKQLLSAVGFAGNNLKIAWAVAMKESNGQPLRFNGNYRTGDKSYGIFQINMIDALNADRKAKFGLRLASELFDPVVNAQIAYYMSGKGTDWSSWHGITAKTKEWMAKFPA